MYIPRSYTTKTVDAEHKFMASVMLACHWLAGTAAALSDPSSDCN